MLPKLFARNTFEKHPEIAARLHDRMARTPARSIVGTLRGLAIRPDRTEILPRISVPTLVLAGSEDALIPLEESESMARQIPGARLVVIPSAGHLAPLEDHKATDAAILEFLESLW